MLSSSKRLKTRLILPTLSSSMANPFRVSASSVIGTPNEELEAASSGLVGENDLLIVGPGVLGRLLLRNGARVERLVVLVLNLFLSILGQEHPGCQVYGQTVTTDHHDDLIKIGINPSLKETKPIHQFPYVIFCAPPYQTSDYPGDVREAALSWNGEGSFLFTSSSAPYDCNDNGQCDEDSPVVPIGRSPRTDVLLKAEKEVGAHVYWLEKGTVEFRADHILNLIHYEDAASLSVAILKKKFRGRIFLGCDNHPLSRQGVMDLVAKSGKFSKKFEGFTGTSDPLGKKLNNTKTREEVGWEPKYPSFAHFLGVSN
ncbi:hypothetical protein GH714_002352 [Hevea brasiliensis]|uniref:NAD-dependent epimerase/dehydratase domain-containing protein n=1 Tax=Hevea brasiliensis TaxID=3981 RepID=A0A6A6KH00_HEVBR|nr:hypothetical protein GH714_002352 [Hevea brasiliensis]